MYLIPESEFFSFGIKAIWDKIVKDGIVFDIGQQYDYCSLWWITYKNVIIKKELLLLIDSLDNPSSLWPLMKRRQYMLNGIHSIGQIDGLITDYALPIVAEPLQFIKKLNEVVTFINSNKIEWNYLKINIPEWSGYLNHDRINEDLLEQNRLKWITKEFDKYTYINLDCTFESYISELGVKTRGDIRKYLRIFECNNFSFKILEGEGIINAYPRMLELNNESWTIFSGIKNLHTAFIYSLLRAKSELSNGKIIMPVLLYEDKIVASVFGYINRRKCYLHTAGIKRYKIRSLAPGITMYILLIRSLIEMKIKILDLSPGIEEYKIRLNGKVQVITQVVIFKNKISMLIYKTSLSILKTMKKF